MEKTEDLSKSEREMHDDHGLTEELESLYRRVASLDQPDVPVEKGADARGSDEDFEDLERGAAPYQNPPTQEELTEKLIAIKDAYERLLTYWPFAQERPPGSV